MVEENVSSKREKSSRVAALEESGIDARDILSLKRGKMLHEIPGSSIGWIPD